MSRRHRIIHALTAAEVGEQFFTQGLARYCVHAAALESHLGSIHGFILLVGKSDHKAMRFDLSHCCHGVHNHSRAHKENRSLDV